MLNENCELVGERIGHVVDAKVEGAPEDGVRRVRVQLWKDRSKRKFYAAYEDGSVVKLNRSELAGLRLPLA